MTVSTTLKKPKINITEIISDLIDLISIRSDFFSHIDIKKILVCLGSNKRNGRGATYGKLVPLKFKNGSEILKFKDRYYTIPGIINNGLPQLYVIYFYSPRFFDLPPFEKLNVIFHELYHIHPKFNGDIRRLGSKKAAHGSSKKRFDKLFEGEAKIFFEQISGTGHMKFLEMDSRSLANKYSVYARRMKIPKPVIVKN